MRIEKSGVGTVVLQTLELALDVLHVDLSLFVAEDRHYFHTAHNSCSRVCSVSRRWN